MKIPKTAKVIFVSVTLCIFASWGEDPDDAVALNMDASKSDVVVGEPVLLTVQWRSKLHWSIFRDVEIVLPVLCDPAFEVYDARSVMPVEEEDAVGLPVYGTRVLAYETEREDSSEWKGLAFEKVLVPLEAGDFNLERAELSCAVVDDESADLSAWERYPSYFDNNFFEEEIPPNTPIIEVESRNLKLRVDPLPESDLKTNMVAVCTKLDISVDAELRRMAVGDPIELSIEISTDSYLEAVNVSVLEPQLEGDAFTFDSLQPSPEYGEEKVVFKRILRAENSDVSEIPAIKAHYFNPRTEEYCTAQSDPVPLEVLPAKKTGVKDAKGPGVEADTPPFLAWLAVVMIVVAATGLVFYLYQRQIRKDQS